MDLSKYEIIDLTHNMYHRMPGWPGHSEFTVEDLKILNIDGYAVKKLSINTHHGTHMDVEAHMVENGRTLDTYPLESLIGRAIVIDVSGSKPSTPIELSSIKKYEKRIGKGDIVLLYTGWDKLRGNTLKYLFEWPYVDTDLAKYLAEKQIKMVGTDGLSIGGWGGVMPTHKMVTDSAGEVHRILLKKNITILEEMANLGKLLNGSEFVETFFMAIPLKLDGADGSPVRAIAFREKAI
jgi:kynurenine formamidase